MNKSKGKSREGLKMARFLMVLSSISPLFILWAIRGDTLIPNDYFVGLCVFLVVAPNMFLWLRIRIAVSQEDKREIVVGKADDHRDHILVYLFAMLLPFYSEDLANWRNFASVVAALAFIVFLFWHLNLHYMNIVFAALGYRVFTIHSTANDNPLSGKGSVVLITPRTSVPSGESILAYRLSDTVYLERRT